MTNLFSKTKAKIEPIPFSHLYYKLLKQLILRLTRRNVFTCGCSTYRYVGIQMPDPFAFYRSNGDDRQSTLKTRPNRRSELQHNSFCNINHLWLTIRQNTVVDHTLNHRKLSLIINPVCLYRYVVLIYTYNRTSQIVKFVYSLDLLVHW